jgi:predicted dehydrogenase
MTRRRFIERSVSLAGVAALTGPLHAAESAGSGKLKAAVIGHTGRGNYGHELDLIFNDRPNIEVVAVADPDAAGRSKAAARCQALREYDDYRQMLAKEKPDLVCIAPRWTDQHHAIAMAALRAGAHLYLEKPFTQTLEEADDLLAVAGQAGLKIAVAHQMPLAPSIQFLKNSIKAGVVGDLLQIRAHGKQDSRAGGEDMVVLGTHLFDLIRFLAGDVAWCSARILQKGREVTLQDARLPAENIGPVIGDEIEAQFALANGVMASFTSRAGNRQTAGHWGLELIGSQGIVKVLADVFPNVYVLKSGEWSDNGKTDQWRRLENDPTPSIPPAERSFIPANKRVVDDWLESIRGRREPVCSGLAAMKSLEMIMAVFQAGVSRARVSFPLQNRKHPLRTELKNR